MALNEETARRLGFGTTCGTLLVRADGPITGDMIDRLDVYGIFAWSDDPERAQLATTQYAGPGVAALFTALVIGMSEAWSRCHSCG